MADGEGEKAGRGGVQAIETGGQILSALTALGGTSSLTGLAQRTGMPAAKVHRYLVSMSRAGLVSQDGNMGAYRIGPMAISIGLAGLRTFQPLKPAIEALARARDTFGETSALAIWAEQGPIVIGLEESLRPITMNVRIGSILSLADTAIGHVFASLVPADQLSTCSTHSDWKTLPAAYRKMIASQLKSFGAVSVEGRALPGVNAIAAPIYDFQGRLSAAIGVIGHESRLSVTEKSGAHATLRKIAEEASFSSDGLLS
ncbi:IclR family transcriptional regulator [Parasphingopyxis sp.]|uniref:IclR family transcriptional regulator n=1 Tax=Parasphingopyxis sp. TaxID=1920299 RepID=UPI00261EA262|nr:IclR family transcriptional regulator [Parasphingopyxis sp.]